MSERLSQVILKVRFFRPREAVLKLGCSRQLRSLRVGGPMWVQSDTSPYRGEMKIIMGNRNNNSVMTMFKWQHCCYKLTIWTQQCGKFHQFKKWHCSQSINKLNAPTLLFVLIFASLSPKVPMFVFSPWVTLKRKKKKKITPAGKKIQKAVACPTNV